MAPTHTQDPADGELMRRANLVRTLLWAMGGVAGAAALSSLFEPRNHLQITAAFYGSIYAGLLVVGRLVKRGHVTLAAWGISIFFWLLIAAATVFFGGMQGQNASIFVVCILLMGVLVSGRAAIGMTVVTSLWCLGVAILETRGALPDTYAFYSPVNAWGALTTQVGVAVALLHSTLESLRRMHERSQAMAQERDEALRRSIQAQKMELVGNLASGIAHDFNNLLTVITGASHLLRNGPVPPDADVAGILDDLDGAATRAGLMTRQLLTFGRAPLTVQETVDVGAAAKALAAMLPRLLGINIHVAVTVEPDALVLASRAAVEQVLLNLAINARDAMPRGGKLDLAVTVQPSTVTLTCKDSGVGMDAATQARIFEPFFTTKATGTGLGLATVWEIVARVGGKIAVESAVGVGTTFVISLPRVGTPGTPGAVTAPA